MLLIGFIVVISIIIIILMIKYHYLNRSMRKLWADHVLWTREYIIATIDGLRDQAEITTRLLRNATDMGDFFAIYYGKSAGDAVTVLITDHLKIAAEIVNAAKIAGPLASTNIRVTAGITKWRKNADDIANALASLSFAFPANKIKNMMYEHLNTTTQEVLGRLNKSLGVSAPIGAVTEDIKYFDIVFNQAMHMADMLSTGIFIGKWYIYQS